jgi:hypothetical protein
VEHGQQRAVGGVDERVGRGPGEQARERGHAGHLAAGRAAEAALTADRIEPIRQSASAALRELRERLDAHRAEQRALWSGFSESESVFRAAFLAGEVARLPQLAGLPRPDVDAFVGPYERVLAAVPPEYQAGDGDPIAFDPAALRPDVEAAVAAAPEAERRLTDWLYEAARGYEAALGRDRTERLLEELRSPERLRELRRERPELFQPQEAVYGGVLGAELLPMLLMLALFSSQAPTWLPPQTSDGALGRGGYGPPAPGEVGNWLERLGAPQGAELDGLFAIAEEPAVVGADDGSWSGDAAEDGTDLAGGED